MRSQVAKSSMVERLRSVMRYAYGRGYHYAGSGWRWGWASDQKLEQAIEAGDHLEVIRSPEFCRHYFTPRVAVHKLPTGNPGIDLIYQRIPDDFGTQWERHYQAIQKVEDPLLYCMQNICPA